MIFVVPPSPIFCLRGSAVSGKGWMVGVSNTVGGGEYGVCCTSGGGAVFAGGCGVRRRVPLEIKFFL